jgi:hypothetical protein
MHRHFWFGIAVGAGAVYLYNRMRKPAAAKA